MLNSAKKKRAIVYAGIWTLYACFSLIAAVLINEYVKVSYPHLVQAFLSWLPDSFDASIAIAVLFACVTGICFYLFLTKYSSINQVFRRFSIPGLSLHFLRRDVIIASVVIFLFWLPIIVIMYPSGFTMDTHNQLYMFQAGAPTYYTTTGETINAEIIDSHPATLTLLYGAFWSLGHAFGSQNFGIFLFVVLQSIVLAVELGLTTCYLERQKVPYGLRFLTLFFFAVFPLFGHYAATMLKDVSYVAVFLPWFLMWLEIARSRGGVLEDRRFIVAFFLLGGFCILFKKLGVYVLVACLIVLIGALGKFRARFLALSIATVVCFSLFVPWIVSPLVGGVAPGGKQEMLSPAIQQTTTLLIEQPDSFSEAELLDINKVFDTSRAQRDYEVFRADGAKNTFHSSATGQDIIQFLQIWLQKGIQHPIEYAYSIAGTTAMQYIPYLKFTYYTDEDYGYRNELFASVSPGYAVDISQPKALIELNNYLEFDSIESKISNLPLVSLFFTQGFYGGWIPVFALLVVLYARRIQTCGSADERSSQPMLLLGLVPALIVMAFFFVSPVSSPRYVLPMLYISPLLLAWAWYALSGTIVQDKTQDELEQCA